MECVDRDSVLVSETRKNVWYTSTHVSDKQALRIYASKRRRR
jgi:hypothetical protein